MKGLLKHIIIAIVTLNAILLFAGSRESDSTVEFVPDNYIINECNAPSSSAANSCSPWHISEANVINLQRVASSQRTVNDSPFKSIVTRKSQQYRTYNAYGRSIFPEDSFFTRPILLLCFLSRLII